jgi:hypothetical protein
MSDGGGQVRWMGEEGCWARYTEEKDEGEGKPTPWFYRWVETVEERKPSPDNSLRAPPGCYPDGYQIPSRSTLRDPRWFGGLPVPNLHERRRLLGGLPRARERRRWLNVPAPVDFVAHSPCDSSSARQREEDG